MLIDWFTVGAQVLNFLILIWLLKRFLYHPILNAIDAREKLIAQALAEAAAKKAEAAREQADFANKNASFDRQQVALLAQASASANAERQRLLELARQDARKLGEQLQGNLQQEAQQQKQAISRRVQEEVFAIVRKTLGDLAGTTLEEHMLATFLARLQGMSHDEQHALKTALQSAEKPLVVRSRFDLNQDERQRTVAAIQALLGTASDIHFATIPELISGIELCSDGHKLAWSIDNYLTQLENRIDELVAPKPAVADVSNKAKQNAD